MPSVIATASSAPRRGKRHQFSFPTKFMYFIKKNTEISFVIALPEKKGCDYENNKWPSNRSKVEL